MQNLTNGTRVTITESNTPARVIQTDPVNFTVTVITENGETKTVSMTALHAQSFLTED